LIAFHSGWYSISKYGILLTPSIAALLMATSSITVVINALSLE